MATVEKQAAERRQVLEIKTLAPERPTVTIDDVDHELRLMQEFGAIEHQQWTRDSQRYDSLWNRENLSKAEKKTMDRLLDDLLDRTLRDSKRLREQLAGDDERTGEPRLSGAIKREIVLAFSNAPLLLAAMAQTPETDTDPETELQMDDEEARDSSTTES